MSGEDPLIRLIASDVADYRKALQDVLEAMVALRERVEELEAWKAERERQDASEERWADVRRGL